MPSLKLSPLRAKIWLATKAGLTQAYHWRGISLPLVYTTSREVVSVASAYSSTKFSSVALCWSFLLHLPWISALHPICPGILFFCRQHMRTCQFSFNDVFRRHHYPYIWVDWLTIPSKGYFDNVNAVIRFMHYHPQVPYGAFKMSTVWPIIAISGTYRISWWLTSWHTHDS